MAQARPRRGRGAQRAAHGPAAVLDGEAICDSHRIVEHLAGLLADLGRLTPPAGGVRSYCPPPASTPGIHDLSLGWLMLGLAAVGCGAASLMLYRPRQMLRRAAASPCSPWRPLRRRMPPVRRRWRSTRCGRGWSCTVASVIHGTAITTFDAHVDDVVSRRVGPGDARGSSLTVSGPAVDATGVGPGFSGSPVTCPGADGTPRIAGAITETIGAYGGKTVLATPIQAILREPVDPPRGGDAQRARRGRAAAPRAPDRRAAQLLRPRRRRSARVFQRAARARRPHARPRAAAPGARRPRRPRDRPGLGDRRRRSRPATSTPARSAPPPTSTARPSGASGTRSTAPAGARCS